MKKLIAIALVLVMAVALLAGCGGKKAAEVTLPAPVAAPSDMEFENDSVAADVAAAKTELKDVLPKVKVGFIFLHDENSTYDKNFIDAAKEACASLGVLVPSLEHVKLTMPEGRRVLQKMQRKNIKKEDTTGG